MSKIIIQDLLKSSLKVKTKRGVLIKIRKFPIENKLAIYLCGNLLTFHGRFLIFSVTPTIK